MPRPALAKVSTASLRAEIVRRVNKLAALIKLREEYERQIQELGPLAGPPAQAPVAAAAKVARKVKAAVKKARAAKVVAAPVQKKSAGRGKYDQTAEEFVLGLLGGKTLTSTELVAEWAKSGRGDKVHKTLGQLVEAKQVKRRKIRGKKGSRYTLA